MKVLSNGEMTARLGLDLKEEIHENHQQEKGEIISLYSYHINLTRNHHIRCNGYLILILSRLIISMDVSSIIIIVYKL
jgi:hypothetical protein